jgi:hypothetical protein
MAFSQTGFAADFGEGGQEVTARARRTFRHR